MEIEPYILDEFGLDLSDYLSESSSNLELRALFINQVDEDLVTIVSLHLINVLLSKGK